MTKTNLEKQNKDLRIRIQNQTAKFDLVVAQYQEKILMLKNDLSSMPDQIRMLQKYISDCETTIDALKTENATLKEEKAELLEINESLSNTVANFKARLKKNSLNSDKPPSRNCETISWTILLILARFKQGLIKSGVQLIVSQFPTNVFVKLRAKSTREKSGKKPGGQPGHKGHGPIPFKDPAIIIEKKPCVCGKCGNEIQSGTKYSARQVVDFEIVLKVTEERVKSGVCQTCGNTEESSFSDAFKGPLQYGDSIKSFVSFLSTYGCVSDLKVAETVNGVLGGVINMSAGTVVNIRRELSDKMETIIDIIREALIISDVLSGDETGIRVNGKLKWGQVFCNDNFALYGLNGKRGDVDESFGILAYFTGILVHDHFMSYYKFKTMTHAECNQHILRYLKGLIEIFNHSWFKDMSDLLITMCHEKNELIRAGKLNISNEYFESFSEKYDEILNRGWLQYKEATQGAEQKEKYHNDERLLLTRLGEYKNEHLLFLKNFDVPFTNNNAEQGLRVLKTKQKVSGCFRSDDGADCYLRIMSLITSLKKQNKLVFNGIRSVFLGSSPFNSS